MERKREFLTKKTTLRKIFKKDKKSCTEIESSEKRY